MKAATAQAAAIEAGTRAIGATLGLPDRQQWAAMRQRADAALAGVDARVSDAARGR